MPDGPDTLVNPVTYGSEGRYYSSFVEQVVGPVKYQYVAYFGERPVAIFTGVGDGGQLIDTELTYLTTDHLGTPVLATDELAAIVWQGGFEPFGADWSSAQEAEVFLRFPGQWENETWENETWSTGLYYNVHRWYEHGTARYTRADPMLFAQGQEVYSYANGRPTILVDRLGEQAGRGTATFGPPGSQEGRCCATALAQGLFDATGGGGLVVCCDGNPVACALVRTGLSEQGMQLQSFLTRCVLQHEGSHMLDLPPCPPQCGVTPAKFVSRERRRQSECTAYGAEMSCLNRAKPLCGNDPICLDLLQRRIEQAQTERRRTWGCTP